MHALYIDICESPAQVWDNRYVFKVYQQDNSGEPDKILEDHANGVQTSNFGNFMFVQNPVSNTITMQLPNFNQIKYNIDIFDVNGFKVQSIQPFNASNPQQFQVDFLRAGAYFLKVTANDFVKTFKFIKT